MTQIRIKGAPQGTRFRQGGEWIGATLSEPEPEPVARTVTITPSRETGVAPAGLTFQAVATGWDVDNPEEDLRYEWDFGDPQAEDFTVLGDRVSSVWDKGANKAYLDRAAHTFFPTRAQFAAQPEADGTPARQLTFAVRCTVTDGVNEVSETREITITNPDWQFRGSRTIVMSADPAEDWSEAPTDPYESAYGTGGYIRTTDPKAGNYTVPEGTRVLHKRGTTHEARMRLGSPTAQQVGAWGSAAERPILLGRFDNVVAGDNIITCDDGANVESSVWGVKLLSNWNATTETAEGGTHPDNEPWTGVGIGKSATGHFSFHDMEIDGCFQGFGSFLMQPDTSLVISNVHIPNWANFGALCSFSTIFAMVGCRWEQDVDAMGGGAGSQSHHAYEDTSAGPQNDHGPLRIGHPSATGYNIISQCEMRSTNGWSRKKNKPSHQPCIRFNTGGDLDGALRVDRAVLEGGNASLNTTTYTQPTRNNIIIDKLVTVGTGNNGGLGIGLDHTGSVLRNFLCIVPPNSEIETGAPENIIGYGSGDNEANKAYTAEALEQGMHIYSGTVIDWSPHDKVAVANGTYADAYDQIEANSLVSNILHHAPAYPVAMDESANLSFSKLFDPSYKGLKWRNLYYDEELADPDDTPDEDQPTLDPSFATEPAYDPTGLNISTVSLPRPTATIAADTGTGHKVALDDLFGNLRGPSPSQGAVEWF